MLWVSALDAGVKLRPTEQERKDIGSAFEKKWEEYYVNAPDKPVMWIGPVSMYVQDRLSICCDLTLFTGS